MLVISADALTQLMQDIAFRAREVTDHNGKTVILPTMTDRQLRGAALSALFQATGQVVWPGDEKLDLRADPAPRGTLAIDR